jgi:hypothetical protein
MGWDETETLDATSSRTASSRGLLLHGGLLMDRLATPSECWEQAALCRTRADAAADDRLQAVWISMAQIWTRLATHRERLQRLNPQGAYSDTATETQVAP